MATTKNNDESFAFGFGGGCDCSDSSMSDRDKTKCGCVDDPCDCYDFLLSSEDRATCGCTNTLTSDDGYANACFGLDTVNYPLCKNTCNNCVAGCGNDSNCKQTCRDNSP